MSRKSTKKASKGRPAGKRALKDLTPQAARAIKGGGKRADGTGGGNVAGGWDLVGNKVHS
jgi:hypothetical protein